MFFFLWKSFKINNNFISFFYITRWWQYTFHFFFKQIQTESWWLLELDNWNIDEKEKNRFGFYLSGFFSIVTMNMNNSNYVTNTQINNTDSGRKFIINHGNVDEYDDIWNCCLVSSTPWEKWTFALKTLCKWGKSIGRCSWPERMRQRKILRILIW